MAPTKDKDDDDVQEPDAPPAAPSVTPAMPTLTPPVEVSKEDRVRKPDVYVAQVRPQG